MKKSFVIGLGVAAMTLVAGSAFAVPDPLYFLNHNDLPNSGPVSTWNGATSIDSNNKPTVTTMDGQKWLQNTYEPMVGQPWVPTPGSKWAVGTGVRVATAASPIECQGVTIMAAVAPKYMNCTTGEPRGEIVDFFYSDLFLAVSHNAGTEGEVIVDYRGYIQKSTGFKIADGQRTILSLVVGQDGLLSLFANGEQKWSYNSGIDYSTLQQSGLGGNAKTICVGRNEYDSWSSFSGNIGDVKIWNTALNPTDRALLENQMAVDMGMASPVPEPGTILAALSILGPAGMMFRRRRK